MADGSHGDRAGPKQLNDLTFSAPLLGLGDSKKYMGETFLGIGVRKSFYRELDQSESCENSDKDSVAATRAFFAADSQNPPDEHTTTADGDDRKKRCIDRYDSSESSDSGVAVLSPSESGGSGSDITEPRSPRSPESSYSSNSNSSNSSSSGSAEEAAGSAGARMPPWASEPAPAAARRIAVQPAPVRRHNPPASRRITEFFNHKMKPQNGLKREHSASHDDPKKKCPKNGVTHELEKYISYLSQTLSPKVLMDVGRQNEATALKPSNDTISRSLDKNSVDHSKMPSSTVGNGTGDYGMSREGKERVHTTMNGFMEVRHGIEPFAKDKSTGGLHNGFADNKKKGSEKRPLDPSANGVNKVSTSIPKGKVPIPALPLPTITRSPIKLAAKPDNRMNGVVSSTTKLDSRMNGVMCGSNNLSLNLMKHKMMSTKKDFPSKKTVDAQPVKKTNRKSSACIANSKNLTWSRANNLKQKCINSNQRPSTNFKQGEANCSSNVNIPNGVRQVPMAVNGNLNNINLPVNNLQNCHQINIPQACNGTTTTNMASFVAVPQNMMLTTLRIPQTGIQTQTLGQPNNMTAFNRQNVNVPSPTKLNGQFMFPLMQNINGTVVQIPNLMAKMPNFVLPQTSQLPQQRQEHLQNQATTTQILINGTLLKLANAMPSSPYSNVNKTTPMNSQPVINKNVPGVPTVGMTVQQKPNYAVNFSHPVLVPQPGFIVTSVPNMNVKETWSYTGGTATSLHSSCSNQMYTGSTATSIHSSCSNQMYRGNTAASLQQPSCPNQTYVGSTAKSMHTTCSNHIYTAATSLQPYPNQLLHHAPSLLSYTNQSIHTNSIPIAPVKPPDNPIQGTEPPSSTVKEPDMSETTTTKCDIPWLSKTLNNNIFPLITSKKSSFEEVSSSFPDKFEELLSEKEIDEINLNIKLEDDSDESRMDLDDDTQETKEDVKREDTIYTEITVVNDVSSNVHNSLLEANFGNESESGIGTDKSIDSPGDSLASKEGDDDSSLCLSVSVCSVETESQKSPLLKQPKTIRFPPRELVKTDGKRASGSDTSSTVTVCLWENCKKEFDGDPNLLNHIQSTHVETQANKENFVCLWERCKVYGKPSCSRLWLERHTLLHGGNKPFKCIVDGCERRFSTQTLLERHVNNHFNESSSNSSGSKKSLDSASKLIRRNGKKLRYRRQPWSARMFDYFDMGMVEGLVWRLVRCTEWRLGGGCLIVEPPKTHHAMTLHASLAATRFNTTTMQREALLTYYPPNVVEDEWVLEKEAKRLKRVEIASLPAHAKTILYEHFCDSYRKEVYVPPVKKPPPAPPAPTRLLPARNCTSSRLLNNLIAKQRQSVEAKPVEIKSECGLPMKPMLFKEDRSELTEASGARKRKLGRRHGGNAFWPCGR